ncbi:hypothetical protein Scep_005329 [Stephania cephalantha]|uniref:Uncharacterized protein n=1 Tax=Stephania cephalantha TaxID=152367 RepID=A0AAP0PXE0_9MAGN
MPSCLSTGRRAEAGAATEERGQEHGSEREIAEPSGGRRTRGHGVGGTRGHGAVLVAIGDERVGAAAKTRRTRGGGKEGRTAALEEKTAQRQRRRTTNSRMGGARPGCRRRVLQRKDKADESRSTSTMKVDDDGDGGGEACAAAGIVRRRRRTKFVFAERGVEEDGLLVFTLFWVATYQCLVICSDLSQISLQISDRLVSVADHRRSITTFAGNLWREKSVIDL